VLAVRTWLAKLEAEGIGQATRAKAYRLLARILGTAVEARYLAVNPCGIRRAASDGAPEMRIATVDQVAAIANRVPARYRALVLVAAFGGCAGASWSACGAATSTAGVWQPAIRAVGVEGLRVHDLRHTAGTLATAVGAARCVR
jgi:hypothetical protein